MFTYNLISLRKQCYRYISLCMPLFLVLMTASEKYPKHLTRDFELYSDVIESL